jgi:hypothetical protein
MDSTKENSSECLNLVTCRLLLQESPWVKICSFMPEQHKHITNKYSIISIPICPREHAVNTKYPTGLPRKICH